MNYIEGLDTSRWSDDHKTSKTIDWKVAKNNGIKFVIMKATEGTFLKDAVYLLHKQNLEGVLPRGSYHFYRTAYTVQAQAKHYYDFSGKLEMPPSLDLENFYSELPTGKKLVDLTVDMLHAIDDQFGQETILYTSPNIIKNYMGNYVTPLLNRKLWVANYGVNIPYIKPWSKWTIWQYSEKRDATSLGFNETTTVDANYYGGTVEDFCKEFSIDYNRFWGDGGSVVIPDPKPEPTTKTFTLYSNRQMNIRNKPSTSGIVVDSLPANTKLEVQDILGNDAWIKLDEGKFMCASQGSVKYTDVREE